MKVGFLSADWSFDFPEGGIPSHGGAGWYRCALPARYLNDNGFEAVVCPLPMVAADGEMGLKDWFGAVHDGFDVIVIQRWMHEGTDRVIRRARATGQVIINDVDDWYGGLRTSNAAFAASHPRSGFGLNRAQARKYGAGGLETETNVKHYAKALAASSALTVSTPYLAERYAKIMDPDRIHLLRNAIDLDRWHPAQRPVTLSPVVGWVGATSHRSSDLEVLRGVLGPFLKDRGLWFHHSGHRDDDGVPFAVDLIGIDGDDWSVQEMCSIQDYPAMFEQIDIGLVPLSSFSFNAAKSGIKGMEYVAAGVPFIASASPEYLWLAAQGIGRTAHRPTDWLRHLHDLTDPTVRAEEARRQRVALEGLDMRRHWQEWMQVFLATLGASVPA